MAERLDLGCLEAKIAARLAEIEKADREGRLADFVRGIPPFREQLRRRRWRYRAPRYLWRVVNRLIIWAYSKVTPDDSAGYGKDA